MITYTLDTKKQYFDELLFHLRKHNNSQTGARLNESKYVYAFNETELVGAMVVTIGWDWVGFNQLYYQNKEVLNAMVTVVSDFYRGRAVGMRLHTNNKERARDFEQIGFDYIEEIDAYPYPNNYHYLENRTFNLESESNHIIVFQDEKNEEYEALQIKKVKEFEEANPSPEKVEELLYVALDGETFVGGVYAEVYPKSIYVDLLAVREDFKGQKIGTTLMNYINDYATKTDKYYIDLGTAEFQAKPFYEKLGYKVTLTRKDYPKGFNMYSLKKYLKEETRSE